MSINEKSYYELLLGKPKPKPKDPRWHKVKGMIMAKKIAVGKGRINEAFELDEKIKKLLGEINK